MKKIYILTLLVVISFTCCGQQVTFNNSNIPFTNSQWYIPNSPTNNDGNRTVVGYIRGLNTFEMRQDSIRFTKLSGLTDRILLINLNGTLKPVAKSNFTYTSSGGISKTGNNFTADLTVLMPRATAEDSIESINGKIVLKADKTVTFTKTECDGRFLQSYAETDPVWISQKASYSTKAVADGLYYGIGNPNSYISSVPAQSFTSLTGKPTTLSGYGITDGYPLTGNPSGFLTSFTESDPLFDTKFSGKTTTGLAEGSNLYYTSARFNVALSTKTTDDLTEGSNLYYTISRFNTGFSGKNSDNLTEGGTNQYFTNARSRGSVSITNTGTSGNATYNSSTGVCNIPNYTYTPPTKTYNFAPARSFVTVAAAANGFQVSSTTESTVTYSATISCAVQIGVATNVEGYVALEISQTNSSTASDWKEVGRITASQNISLALALASTQKSGGCVIGIVPAGYYTRLRSVNVSGAPVYTYNSGQEVY